MTMSRGRANASGGRGRLVVTPSPFCIGWEGRRNRIEKLSDGSAHVLQIASPAPVRALWTCAEGRPVVRIPCLATNRPWKRGQAEVLTAFRSVAILLRGLEEFRGVFRVAPGSQPARYGFGGSKFPKSCSPPMLSARGDCRKNGAGRIGESGTVASRPCLRPVKGSLRHDQGNCFGLSDVGERRAVFGNGQRPVRRASGLLRVPRRTRFTWFRSVREAVGARRGCRPV